MRVIKLTVILRSEASSGSYQKMTPAKNVVQILNTPDYRKAAKMNASE